MSFVATSKSINGFVFQKRDGKQRKVGTFNVEFHDRLARVKEEKPYLFEPTLDITDAYAMRRSLRRGSTTEARNLKVRPEVVDMNNRWRKWEQAKGRMPNMSMASHYTELLLSLPTLYEYSYSF